jgi:ribosomal protein S8
MTMTDPIADMLTRLRNANQAFHDEVSMPYSKMKAGLAEILQQGATSRRSTSRSLPRARSARR